MNNRIEFYVPLTAMVEFTEILTKNEIENEIIGITDESEIIVYVEFTDEQGEAIAKLTELVDYYDYEEGDDDNDDD